MDTTERLLRFLQSLDREWHPRQAPALFICWALQTLGLPKALVRYLVQVYIPPEAPPPPQYERLVGRISEIKRGIPIWELHFSEASNFMCTLFIPAGFSYDKFLCCALCGRTVVQCVPGVIVSLTHQHCQSCYDTLKRLQLE